MSFTLSFNKVDYDFITLSVDDASKTPVDDKKKDPTRLRKAGSAKKQNGINGKIVQKKELWRQE